MFSKVTGKVDLYPKQTIPKESPTRTTSAPDSSTKEPDIESHAVNTIIFRELFLYLTRSEGSIRTMYPFLSKIANMMWTRPFAVLTPKPGQDRKVAATWDA